MKKNMKNCILIACTGIDCFDGCRMWKDRKKYNQ